MNNAHAPIVTPEQIAQTIALLRGQKVLLDATLAGLYGVETRVLIQAVKRNRERFPGDFLFQLTTEEAEALRSQTVISRAPGRGGRRYRPYAFTEQGVAMLSSVLRSKQAIQVNVEIMRAFVRLRGMLAANRQLAVKLEELERKIASHDQSIAGILSAIRQLMASPEPRRRPIGFVTSESRGPTENR
ncbi:MAG: ORF6N domain-containing protein [Betaproteobacteria bacterium]|jgi:hypothetical protein|nr:ORF6N domain-containing protein [Betaproteobacteria bacterium]